MWFDKPLGRSAPGLRSLLLVVLIALVGAGLAVQAALHWRTTERASERTRLLQQTADAVLSQTSGGGHAGGGVVAGPE